MIGSHRVATVTPIASPVAVMPEDEAAVEDVAISETRMAPEGVALADSGAGPAASEAEAPILPAGALLAPGYWVIQLLRRGNDLDVYDVWSDERACRCIAKLPRPDRRGRSTRRRLINEGSLLLSLAHPHIVRAYELLNQPHSILILELLAGPTLSQLIEQETRLSQMDGILLGYQLCSALNYLHQRGTLHIDLKPSNIIITDRMVKVIDLSLAQPAGPGSPGVGTDRYMAPEQVRGDRLSPATDTWGIGIVLFVVLTGQRPFPEPDDGCEPLQLSQRAPSIRCYRRLRPGLASIIDQCLEPTPMARPSIARLAATLRALTPPGTIMAPS